MPQLFANGARAILTAGIAETGLALSLDDMSRLPVGAADWFRLVLEDASDPTVFEVVTARRASAGATTATVIARGQEGTTARAWPAGTIVGLRVTAADMAGLTDGLAAAQPGFAQVYSSTSTNGTDLAVQTVHAVYVPSAYARYLPSAPTIGDTIVLTSPWNHFGNGLFTLARRNAAHYINGLQENVVFDVPACEIVVRYVYANYWSLG